MNPALDGFIRIVSLVQYQVIVMFRGPLEQRFGRMEYIRMVISAHEIFQNFAGLPEEAKAMMRQRMRPIFLATIVGLVLGAML